MKKYRQKYFGMLKKQQIKILKIDEKNPEFW